MDILPFEPISLPTSRGFFPADEHHAGTSAPLSGDVLGRLGPQHGSAWSVCLSTSAAGSDRAQAELGESEPNRVSRRAFSVLFFSREEARIHVHVQTTEGEAKFWIEPQIELARNYELNDQDLKRALELTVEHEQEIRDAWTRHFGS